MSLGRTGKWKNPSPWVETVMGSILAGQFFQVGLERFQAHRLMQNHDAAIEHAAHQLRVRVAGDQNRRQGGSQLRSQGGDDIETGFALGQSVVRHHYVRRRIGELGLQCRTGGGSDDVLGA